MNGELPEAAETTDEIRERLEFEHLVAQEVSRLTGTPLDIVKYQAVSSAAFVGLRSVDVLRGWIAELEGHDG